jgi:two-component system, NtrC family, sensor histidine kinase HydH
VASVVHEIRNPLSAVKMNLRILENKCATDPVVAEHFKLAREQTDRLESMLEELLDYSKPVVLKKETITVSELIRETLINFDSDGAPSHPTISEEIDPQLPAVRVDRKRMAQVLLNLVLNARQAGGPEATIRITADEIRNHGRRTVRLSVIDQGRGISEENLKHIFEPFFTTRKQGTGLGLSNARKIVEAHGGSLTVESKVEHGTSVAIMLPMGDGA